MKREIFQVNTWCDITIKMDGFAEEPVKWLTQQMRTHNLHYLLAHADDGVIWGWFDGEELITSHDVAPHYSPPLRASTLQMSRIFAPAGEVLIWRDEAGTWTGQQITETNSYASSTWTMAFDEQHILWGTRAEPLERGFTLLSEGSQSFFHAVPHHLSTQSDLQSHRVALVVRQYVQADDEGFIQIHASRLVQLKESTL